MDHQTTLNGRTSEASPAAAVSRNLADFLHDLLTLGELQLQLLGADLKEAFQRILPPIGFIIAAIVLVAASVPLLLMGVVWVLVLRAGLSQDVAFFVTAGGGILIAAILGFLAWQGIQRLGPIVARSQVELKQNLLWIKHALKKHRHYHDSEL